MKLTNIYCQAFGYNKEYHDKLHNDLSKRKQYQQNANEFIKQLTLSGVEHNLFGR